MSMTLITLLSALATLLVCVSAADFSYCTGYHDYNVLLHLTRQNKCMDMKTVFDHLYSIHPREDTVSCRMHIIRILADHFGPHARTPNNCQCDGKMDLMQYHTDVYDGTSDHRDSCLRHHNSYRVLYHQFFESPHSHAGHCRTHDSVWYHLDQINREDNDGCQRDFILHLRYSLTHHSNHCTCKEVQTHSAHHTTHHTTQSSKHWPSDPTTKLPESLTTIHNVHHIPDLHCQGIDSYIKLLYLEHECLSANSVWHYLDDLQAKDPKCRQNIQHHLATKFKDANSSSEMSNLCTCHERTELKNHGLHSLKNGTYRQCSNSNGTYYSIVSQFFSRIRDHGCQNHHVLWQKLDGINNYCSHHNNGKCASWTDCEQDLMIRAFLQYPTDDSDSCVCSKAHATTSAKTTIASETATSATRSPTTTLSTTTTQRTTPKLPFFCDKIKVIEDVASSLPSTHVNSSNCFTGSSDDAIILSTCNVTSPSTWKKGANVMTDCESSSQLITTYTPIASFDRDTYFSNGAQSGIFLGCSGDGLKMVLQKCNGVPEIVHIEHGTFLNNPRNYYVIVTQ